MTNADQEEFWNGSAGPAWVYLQAQMDALMQPVLDLLLETAALRPGDRVLDIGCGTGASILAAARRVGDAGHVTGLDIADIMLTLARTRVQALPNTALLKADAQTHPFEPNSFDRVISRFGVMFFEDSVAAFANMARAVTPGGTMTFAAWGPAPDNPWFMAPAAAAADVLGPMPKVDRTQPGPFAFEQIPRVTAMMEAAGLSDIRARNIDLSLTPAGTLRNAADLCCRIGPADRALQFFDADDRQRRALADAIAQRFAVYDGAQGLRIPASINVYEARKSA